MLFIEKALWSSKTRLETKLEQVSSAVLSPRLSAAKAAAARIERAASSARGAGAAGDGDEPILSPQVLRATLANFQERVVEDWAAELRGALDGAAGELRAAAAEGAVRAAHPAAPPATGSAAWWLAGLASCLLAALTARAFAALHAEGGWAEAQGAGGTFSGAMPPS